VKGYNARALAARYAALEAAFFTAALTRCGDINAQHTAFLDALDTTPRPTYREEAVTCGLHPPEE
jgi:hypothetical protein